MKYANKPEIIAVVGPRQCGKTTLLRHIAGSLPSSIFLSFEDKNILDLFENRTDEFIGLYAKKNKYLFIDEFQYAKEGGKKLKYIYDLHHIKMFVTGSSSIDLTVKTVKYLVGRIFIFTLLPFDFQEFLAAKNPSLEKFYNSNKIALNKKIDTVTDTSDELRALYEEYVIYGGYPRAVISDDHDEKKKVLANIYNTYFLREVKDILGLIDDYKLLNLIKALSSQAGNLIDYQELCRISELTYPTLKKYLNFLEKTYVCRPIRPFFKNKRVEIVKNPKIYFFDTGLRNYAINNFSALEERTDAGAILENAVFGQLTKEELLINYWRTKQKLEVDFVVSMPDNKITALEIKKTLTESDTSSISAREFKRQYNQIPILFAYWKTKDELPILNTLPVYLI